jgi:phosphatidylglycerophosphatase A
VVIDEVVGLWLVLAVAPLDPVYYGLGFALFRLFDIFKPWPVSWVERRFGGGIGIMADDVVAAVYAGAILMLLTEWAGV